MWVHGFIESMNDGGSPGSEGEDGDDATDVGEQAPARPRGVLTDADRNFLRNPETYSDQAAYNRRADIRERTRNGILDFTDLFEALVRGDESYRHPRWLYGLREDYVPGEAPASPVNNNLHHLEDEELRGGLRDMIAFALWLTGGNTLPAAPEGGYEGNARAARDLLDDAIRRVGRAYGVMVHDVDLDVTSEPIPYNEVITDLQKGEDVPADQLGYLLAGADQVPSIDEERTLGLLREDLREQLAPLPDERRRQDSDHDPDQDEQDQDESDAADEQ
jgi:hypothetical protein